MISQQILIKDSPFPSSQKNSALRFWLILKLLSSPLSLVCSKFSTQTLMFHWLIQFETLFPSLSFLIVWEFHSLVIISESARILLWVGETGHRWIGAYPSAHPHFLWVDGNMEIDSWAFLSNSSGDALPVVGSKQGQTDMLSHKSVLAMSSVWKVVYTQRNNMNVEKKNVKCGTAGWLIWGPNLCVYS